MLYSSPSPKWSPSSAASRHSHRAGTTTLVLLLLAALTLTPQPGGPRFSASAFAPSSAVRRWRRDGTFKPSSLRPSAARRRRLLLAMSSGDGGIADRPAPPLPDDGTLTKLLDVAVRASVLAGEIILGNAGGADVLKSKANSRDLLTLIDPLCEKVRRRGGVVVVESVSVESLWEGG